ncbi:MAG: cytochrome P450 [Myxococcales bacterium]|nr:cytochrome P450 [Myxococcales bacterium]
MAGLSVDQIPLLSGAVWPSGHAREVERGRIAFLHRFNAECGDIGRLRFFRTVVVVNSPSLLHEMLVEKGKVFEKSPVVRGALYPLVGEGLFTSRGELWRRQRKLMAPMFQPAQIARYALAMAECTRRGVATWQDGATVEMARETTRITMSIAGRTLFDAETFDEADAIGAALTTALHWADETTVSLALQIQIEARQRLERLGEHLPPSWRARIARMVDALEPPLLLPGARSRELRAAIGVLDERVQRMIDERRAAGLTRSDLLTALLKSRDEDGARMSDRQVRDEVLTLFVAGHETTATGLAWSLHLLARHPESMRRVRAEVDALDGRTPGVTDLPRLTYTLQVFKEALRLYPPVYLFGRQATEEVTLGGYRLPRGTIVLVSPYGLHRRPAEWPDPERFDPDRFTPEAEAARPRTAWLPFSAGPRTCIGNHFALMEAQIALAIVIQRAELTSVGEVEPEPGATLRPRGGMPMIARLRRHN